VLYFISDDDDDVVVVVATIALLCLPFLRRVLCNRTQFLSQSRLILIMPLAVDVIPDDCLT